MKFFLVFLGLFAVATAAPLAMRRAEHAALAPPSGVVGGRDIKNGDMMRRSDNSLIQVVRANDDSIKRNLGEILETRQLQAAVEIVEAVVDLVEGIIDMINEDNTKRDQFTGTDWGHTHHELDISLGRTIGTRYELYWFRSGTFTRNGDGGYLNWAYEGVVTGTENGGSVVHFAAP
ncbi:hypothetical protein K443DRAFT_409255 [Laccaria amethystina LaAM-08-1]|uniref:Uncharacterized protein n=1 Tax=Laccaria amethystina LaAM-08-1 TaxID=1095629 RepID=A0A0C9XA03_9AGAR|nr:hypothetical protein K443DRAFT_409255 [Laccaria amethystina LaAM-08-1]